MTRRRATTDLAERLLGGPVVWIGLVMFDRFCAGAVHLDVAHIAEGSAGTLRDASPVPAAAPTFENYIDAWTSPVTPFSRFFLNSLWVCSVTMVATTLVSVLAGYAIARFPFRRARCATAHLSCHPDVSERSAYRPAPDAMARARPYQYLPGADIFEFLVHGAVHSLDDGRLFQFDSARPRRKRDDRRLQPFGALCRIVLPLAAPGIAATAIFAFVVSWSELLFAISFTTETSMRTLSAGLLYMVGQYEVQWGRYRRRHPEHGPGSGAVYPLQRHLIHGLTAGAVKG